MEFDLDIDFYTDDLIDDNWVFQSNRMNENCHDFGFETMDLNDHCYENFEERFIQFCM